MAQRSKVTEKEKYSQARSLLEESLLRVEKALIENQSLSTTGRIEQAYNVIFESQTQACREVLLGCLLTRITDRSKNIRHPYTALSDNAFSGRSLDERIVNPFLQEKSIPGSRGPYLSVFRRQVKFDKTTRPGLKDKDSYDAFLDLLEIIEKEDSQENLVAILDYILYRFVLLREQTKIDLIHLDRISLNQYKYLIRGLLEKPSRGQLPMVLALAMVETIIHRFSLQWEVDFQGINVADKASGAGGDITIKESGKALLTIEVTERPVNAHRVRTTFTDKITAGALSDYVFLVRLEQIGDEAKQQVEKYFAHGYDVNFVDIQEWLINTLVTVGVKGRKHFQERIVYHLSKDQVPKILKLAWNEEIGKLIAA